LSRGSGVRQPAIQAPPRVRGLTDIDQMATTTITPTILP
jgi:hypothetical protein